MAMQTKNLNLNANMTAPAESFADVTPDDNNDLTDGPARAFYVGVSGDLALVNTRGDTSVFKSVPIGIFPVRGVRVKATGTTADSIVALY